MPGRGSKRWIKGLTKRPRSKDVFQDPGRNCAYVLKQEGDLFAKIPNGREEKCHIDWDERANVNLCQESL